MALPPCVQLFVEFLSLTSTTDCPRHTAAANTQHNQHTINRHLGTRLDRRQNEVSILRHKKAVRRHKNMCILYITRTVHCCNYRISQTNHLHTLLCTKMFKQHCYMFWTFNCLTFSESHNLKNWMCVCVCVCEWVICEIVTLPEDEPVNGSKHVGV
jgi:hypothetical protein